MESKHKLGLIGKNISYSFSKNYFEQKFKKKNLTEYSYDIFDIQEIEEIERVFSDKNIFGLNVTIPYKEKVIQYLDELSDEAEKIGAVNCIAIVDGKRKGYNTDAFGFEKTLAAHQKSHHQSALILGDGGAAKAVQYVLNKRQISFKTISRKSELNFDNVDANIVSEHTLIIHCTPVGTFPNVEDCVRFPFEALTKQHLVIDLIYNPECTQFLIKAAENGAKTVNGLYMLEQQAEKAWEIWSFQKK